MDGKVEVQMPMPNATDAMKQAIPLSITEKIDMEKMQWFIAEDVKAEIPDFMNPGNPMQKMDMSVKMMMDVGAKKVAFGMKGNMPGLPDQMNNCTYLEVPWLADATTVSTCVKTAFDKQGLAPPEVPGLNIEGPVCKQLEDGFDTWTLKFQNETM